MLLLSEGTAQVGLRLGLDLIYGLVLGCGLRIDRFLILDVYFGLFIGLI